MTRMSGKLDARMVFFARSSRVPDHAEFLPPISRLLNQISRFSFTLLGMIQTCHSSPFPINDKGKGEGYARTHLCTDAGD